MENEHTKSDIISLSQAEIGKRYQVVSVKTKSAVHQRMLDMGLVPGVKLWVVRFAPLGDPIEIRIRHFLMSLRKDEAEGVDVVDLGYHHNHHHMKKKCDDCHGKRGRGRGQGRNHNWLRHHRWKKEDNE